MSDLAELLERVKAATGPDSELADAVWLAVVPGAQRVNKMAQWPEEKPIWEYFDPERNTYSRFIPNILGSIDAALALTERILPGHQWMLDKQPDHFDCVIWDGVTPKAKANETAPTLPLSILAALLSALIAQEPQP